MAAAAAVAARLGWRFMFLSMLSHPGVASACLLASFERGFRPSFVVGLISPFTDQLKKPMLWPTLATSCSARASVYGANCLFVLSCFPTRVGVACGAAALALVRFLLRDNPRVFRRSRVNPVFVSSPRHGTSQARSRRKVGRSSCRCERRAWFVSRL